MKSEKNIKSEILLFLSEQKIFAWNNATGTARSMDGLRVISFGLPGSPDVLGVLPGGRAFGIETKTSKGVQRETQKIFQKRFEAAGGLYILARNVEQVIDALKENGVLP